MSSINEEDIQNITLKQVYVFIHTKSTLFVVDQQS